MKTTTSNNKMNTQRRAWPAALAATALLACPAFAVLDSTVNGTAGAAQRAVITPPAPPAASASAATGAAASSANRASGSAASGSLHSATGAETGANASANAPGRSLAADIQASGGASASLNASRMVSEIQSSVHPARETLLMDVDQRLDQSQQALKDVRAKGRDLREDAREEFKTALDDAQAKWKTVKASLKSARKAAIDQWTDARSQLAQDYDAYARAIARTEAVASGASLKAGSEGMVESN